MAARRSFLALAGTLVVGLAACGGDGGGGGAPAPKPAESAKQEIIRKADKICADAQAEAGKVKQPKGADPEAVQTYIRKVARVQEQAVADIKALQPPPEGKAEFDKFVAANEELSESFDGLIEAVEERDKAAFAKVNRKIQENSAKAQSAAQAYGFKTCGRTQAATR